MFSCLPSRTVRIADEHVQESDDVARDVLPVPRFAAQRLPNGLVGDRVSVEQRADDADELVTLAECDQPAASGRAPVRDFPQER
jgi:hypothetical protein